MILFAIDGYMGCSTAAAVDMWRAMLVSGYSWPTGWLKMAIEKGSSFASFAFITDVFSHLGRERYTHTHKHDTSHACHRWKNTRTNAIERSENNMPSAKLWRVIQLSANIPRMPLIISARAMSRELLHEIRNYDVVNWEPTKWVAAFDEMADCAQQCQPHTQWMSDGWRWLYSNWESNSHSHWKLSFLPPNRTTPFPLGTHFCCHECLQLRDDHP